LSKNNNKKDSYDSKRKAQELPAHDLYTGRRREGPAPAQSSAASRMANINRTMEKDSPAGKAPAMDAGRPAGAARTANAGQPSDGARVANAARTNAGQPSGGARSASATRTNAGVLTANTRADDIAEALAEILQQETLLYQDAADISAKKTDIIVHGKIEELDSLVKAEQAIILKIGRLEDEREKVVMALSEELDLDLEGVTLSDINSHLSSESYAKLDDCQKDLAGTLGSLKNTNDMNSQLIQNALDYVNFSVNLLTTNQDSGNNYSQDGDDGVGKERRSIFDVKL